MTDEHIAPSVETSPAMAEPPVVVTAEPDSVAPPQAQPGPGPKRGGTPLWLTLGFVIILAAEPVALQMLVPLAATSTGEGDSARVTALATALDAATKRIDALEARGSVAVATTTGVAAAPLDTSRIDALESRLATLERQPAPVMPDVTGQVAAASAALSARIAALDEQIQHEVAQATARAAFANRLRAASGALEAGQPVGEIAGAPAELARFATTAPPTEPALRLSFSGYADAARAASQPDAPGEDALGRAIQRVQSLVTIRQGDQVIVGSRAAVVLEDARGKLDAGDLAGAVSTLGKLDTGARAAIGPWLRDAKALVDARAALLALVAKS